MKALIKYPESAHLFGQTILNMLREHGGYVKSEDMIGMSFIKHNSKEWQAFSWSSEDERVIQKLWIMAMARDVMEGNIPFQKVRWKTSRGNTLIVDRIASYLLVNVEGDRRGIPWWILAEDINIVSGKVMRIEPETIDSPWDLS